MQDLQKSLGTTKKFKKWVTSEILPSIRKTGKYEVKQESNKENLDKEMLAFEYTSRILSFSEVSKLQITHHIYERHQIPTDILPQYVENVKVTFSASDLLKKNDCGISIRAFNDLMVANGYLEDKERIASKGKIKKFKALTEKGLQYGQNDVSKHNPRETQPHYFEDSFMDLFDILTMAEAA